MPIRILFVAHDMGGINAIIPVIRLLSRKHPRVLVKNIFTGPAEKYARTKNITHIRLMKMTPNDLETILDTFQPDMIVSGTSSGVTLEKLFLPLARKRGILTVAILDAWLNYSYQFSRNVNGSFGLADLPDWIFVMDETAKRGMVRAGFPCDRLIVTGNPFFETFRPLPTMSNSQFGKTVLWVDQHFSELIRGGVHETVGFDELEAFQDAVKELERYDAINRIIIKLHPGAHDRHRYDAIIRSTRLPIIFAGNESLGVLFRKSHIIIGMNSAVLFEAALRGKTVVSYQPRSSRVFDPLMSNRLHISLVAYSRIGLRRALRVAFKRKTQSATVIRRIRAYTKNRATQNVIAMIEQLVEKSYGYERSLHYSSSNGLEPSPR